MRSYNHTFLLPFSLLLFILMASCDTQQKAPQAGTRLNSSSEDASCKEEGANLTDSDNCKSEEDKKKEEEDKKRYADFDPETDALDDYRTETGLGKNFNRDEIKAPERDPADVGKVFVVLRVPFYKILWFDLTKAGWADNAHAWLETNIFNPATGANFPPLGGERIKDADNISIFQPMPMLKAITARTGNFRVVGFTAHDKLELPSFPSLTLGLLEGESQSIFAEPEDYQLIYNQGVPGYPQLYEECLSEENYTKMMIDETLKGYCQTMMPEVVGNIDNINYQGASIEASPWSAGGNPDVWKNYLDVQSIAIWKPIPPEGYGCLGYAASNGEQDKPKIETLQQGRALGLSDQAGMYCIKKQFLAPGVAGKKIVDINKTDAAGKQILVQLYNIEPKDPKVGYSGSNFFYAIGREPLINDPKKEQLWVLKKEFLKILEDEKLMKPEK